ncbi:peptidase M19 renal dipeptidase [Haladaptatus paucihalophilus DX253]|uniref:Membrane dipeptidase n=1 Tax=Haladaptatus paucihalophilus DX253 TaxID=797209 RepID=E7QYG8_HALPU|nr:dipeptidase [Haladaptatus paucihalophilus]EFW90234.1 peptidase M19 renal dipeptidase [Haladaptatus paucihalophilus DX253]SHJ98818.1 membrane dipeptidase [Haladaptatus paucihalophilus DX253]
MSFPPVVDGHNDTLLRLHGIDDPVATFTRGTEEMHIDRPRAREAGLGVGFFATFVSGGDDHELRWTDDGYEFRVPDALDHDDARATTYRMLELLHRLAAEIEDFRVVRSLDDFDACLESGDLGAVAHIEGAEGVAPDCANLDFLYAAGVRSIGPVWSRPNAFGAGVPTKYPSSPDVGGGLTDAGRDLVRACEERGIVIDCAHLTEAGFWDVAETIGAPLVASHTGAHALSPHSRNLTDEQIDAVADSNGVVGIGFLETVLSDEPNPEATATMADLVDHIEYVADRAGSSHVVLGSDFDGARIPDDVGDVTGLPDVLAALRERGFSEDDVAKVAHENWRRVLAETW